MQQRCSKVLSMSSPSAHLSNLFVLIRTCRQEGSWQVAWSMGLVSAKGAPVLTLRTNATAPAKRYASPYALSTASKQYTRHISHHPGHITHTHTTPYRPHRTGHNNTRRAVQSVG